MGVRRKVILAEDAACVAQAAVESSAAARRLLWHMTMGVDAVYAKAMSHQPYEKRAASIFWVISGSGRLCLGDRTLPLSVRRSFWIVDLEKPRAYLPDPGAKLAMTMIHFSGPNLECWLEELKVHDNPEFQWEDWDFLRRWRIDLMRLARQRPVGWEWKAHERLMSLLGRLATERKVWSFAECKAPAAVAKVIALVSNSPFRKWTVRELAKRTGASYAHLRRQFHQARGESVQHFISTLRVDHARRLLAQESRSIKDISAAMQFSSEFNFSHFFRKHAGISPSRYRQQLRARNLSV